MRILLSLLPAILSSLQTQVKAILVNIFGGIVDCATIANGIIAACKEITVNLPIVVRLEGDHTHANCPLKIMTILTSTYYNFNHTGFNFVT